MAIAKLLVTYVLLASAYLTVNADSTIHEVTRPKFDPKEYEANRKSVTCKARALSGIWENGIANLDMSYIHLPPSPEALAASAGNDTATAESKKEPVTLLMVHGWPAIWSTWARQIEAFKDDKYNIIVPDVRGYGRSGHLADPEGANGVERMQDIVNDLICILENEKVKTAVCMGHDWGSAICYEAARLRPDIFKGVIGLAVPYFPATPPYVPIEAMLPKFPHLAYQLYFSRQTLEAAKELDKDVRKSLKAVYRTKGTRPPNTFLTSQSDFLSAYDGVDMGPIPFLSSVEEDYLVEEFSKNGFKHTLGFYKEENRKATWEFANKQGNHTLRAPVLTIYPDSDLVADWLEVSQLAKSNEWIMHLTTKVVSTSHWPHLEAPDVVNAMIREWIENPAVLGIEELVKKRDAEMRKRAEEWKQINALKKARAESELKEKQRREKEEKEKKEKEAAEAKKDRNVDEL